LRCPTSPRHSRQPRFLAEAQLGERRTRLGNYLFGSFGRDFVSRDGRRFMLVNLTSRHWRGLGTATGLGQAVVALENSIGMALRGNPLMNEVDQPGIGPHMAPSSPIRAWQQVAKRAPVLGEHTDVVLSAWLGLAPDELEALHMRGTIESQRSTPPDIARTRPGSGPPMERKQ
jgi:2-methylfumaryl-CoA isomerase